MTDHISAPLLNALADGELSSDQLAIVQEHLDVCPSCTSEALTRTLLKPAIAKAGKRYTAPSEFEDRMKSLISAQAQRPDGSKSGNDLARSRRKPGALAYSGWAAAAALFLVLAGSLLLHRLSGRTETAAAGQTALASEIADLHVATLAASQPLQVLSSDRHTVKPWFQGKIPFAFNLPEDLPEGTRLDGANLVFLHSAPVAQLIYSIGRHRASVFVRQPTTADAKNKLPTEYSGFQIAGFNTAELDVVAVTDADRAHLTSLVSAIEQAQTNATVQQASPR